MEANVPHEAQPRQGLGVDHESLQQPQSAQRRNKGGWITFPFLGAAMMGLGLATSGALSNLVVYLIKEYNVPSVDAAQIANIINGCINLAPVAGAVVADAFFGCYPVVAISMAFAVLSTVVFTLTASLRGLRPAPCHLGAGACEPASAGQMAALYAGVFLLCVSAAGDHGRRPVRLRRRPRCALQLVLRLLVRLHRARIDGNRLRPGHGGVDAGIRNLCCRLRRRLRGVAPRGALLPPVARAGQPVHVARSGGRRRRQEVEGQRADGWGVEVLPWPTMAR